MKKIKGMRWWMIALVTLGLTLNYLARSSLATAAPTFEHELLISDKQYAYIVAAFQAAYMVMQPVAGYLLDVLGTKIGFAIFFLFWSIMCMGHALARGWVSLAIFRGLTGMAEAASIPSGLKASSEWFPAKERSIATGWFNVGSSIGALVAPPLVAWCVMTYNWRLAFVAIGVGGLIWVVLWSVFFKNPKDQKHLSDEERDYILSGQEAAYRTETNEKPSWSSILSSRAFWSIAIPRFLAEPAWQTFNFWIPMYMATVYHMNLKSIAMCAWLPFLTADLGCVVGGYLAPFFQKHCRVSLITSRKLVMVSGAICMIGPGCIGLVAGHPYWAIALFCLGGFAHQTLSGALFTLASDTFTKRDVATATGLMGMMGYLGATIFSLVLGSLISKFGYHPMFAALACFDLIGACVVWFCLKNHQGNTETASD